MVTSIVLMQIKRNMITEVATQLTDIDGVTEVYSVAGKYDLVCMIRVSDNDKLAEVVTQKMLQVEGILESETLISFRVFSELDLDGMFSIGMK